MTVEVAGAGKLGAARTLAHRHGSSTGASSGDLTGTDALSTGRLVLDAAIALVAQQHAETSAVALGSPQTALHAKAPRRDHGTLCIKCEREATGQSLRPLQLSRVCVERRARQCASRCLRRHVIQVVCDTSSCAEARELLQHRPHACRWAPRHLSGCHCCSMHHYERFTRCYSRRRMTTSPSA